MNEKILTSNSDENSNSEKDKIKSNEDLDQILSNNIKYPFEEIKYIPIKIGPNKEQCFLYLSNYDFKFFEEYINYHFEDKKSKFFENLENNIFENFCELYSKFSLKERLKIFSEEINSIKPNYSFAFEMSESLKTRSSVKEQINDYEYRESLISQVDNDPVIS